MPALFGTCRRTVAYAKIDPRVEPAIPRQAARGGDEHAAGIDSDDAAARANGGSNVTGEDSGAGAHLQHAPPHSDTAETQEAPTQPDLVARGAPRLQERDEVLRIRLPVDGAIGVGIGRHSDAHSGPAGVRACAPFNAGARRGRTELRTRGCRNGSPCRPPPSSPRATSRRTCCTRDP